jgi:hypothetical protein
VGQLAAELSEPTLSQVEVGRQARALDEDEPSPSPSTWVLVD